ncbi:unnamed protein product [Rhizophagus irregularis]|nr:unnamed protein product [Rhizophagus irregularis]
MCTLLKNILKLLNRLQLMVGQRKKLIELYSDFSVLVGDDMKDKLKKQYQTTCHYIHWYIQVEKWDVIIAFDSSGTVNKHEDFVNKQEELASRKGIKIEERDLESKYCEIYNYLPNVESDGPSAAHPCTLCYIPYLPNDKVKKISRPCVEYL